MLALTHPLSLPLLITLSYHGQKSRPRSPARSILCLFIYGREVFPFINVCACVKGSSTANEFFSLICVYQSARERELWS